MSSLASGIDINRALAFGRIIKSFQTLETVIQGRTAVYSSAMKRGISGGRHRENSPYGSNTWKFWSSAICAPFNCAGKSSALDDLMPVLLITVPTNYELPTTNYTKIITAVNTKGKQKASIIKGKDLISRIGILYLLGMSKLYN